MNRMLKLAACTTALMVITAPARAEPEFDCVKGVEKAMALLHIYDDHLRALQTPGSGVVRPMAETRMRVINDYNATVGELLAHQCAFEMVVPVDTGADQRAKCQLSQLRSESLTQTLLTLDGLIEKHGPAGEYSAFTPPVIANQYVFANVYSAPPTFDEPTASLVRARSGFGEELALEVARQQQLGCTGR